MPRVLWPAAVGLSLLAAASPGQTLAERRAVPERLVVGMAADGGGNVGLVTAKELGLFEARGLDVEFTEVSTSTLCLSAMISGHVAICAGVGGVPLVYAVLAGAELAGIAALVDTMTFSFVGSPEITTMAQLKGRRVGINRLGGAAEFAIRYVLADAGLAPSDVEIFQAGRQPARLAALEAGSIQATVMSPPAAFVARELGFTLLVDVASLGLDYPHNLLIATRAMSREHPQTTRRFLEAAVEGTRYFKTHREAGRRILGRYMGLDQTEVLAETYDFFARVIADVPLVSSTGMQILLTAMGRTNPAAAQAGPNDFLEMRFVREMQERGLLEAP